MSKTARYIFIAVGVAILGFILWYFKSIVAYILISLVLSLIGKPFVLLFKKLHLGKFSLPKSICALLALILLCAIFFTFFRIFIPLVANEANELSTINPDYIYTNIQEPLHKIDLFIKKFELSEDQNFSMAEYISDKLVSIFNVSFMTNLFSSFAGILGNIFIALFSIIFITFFFLKDEKMFSEAILLLVPDQYIDAFSNALKSTQRLLMRYFIGIVGQIFEIILLVTIGLTIIGIGFRLSLVIGLIAGLLTIIPYIGPMLGSIFGIILGLANHLDMNFSSELIPLTGYMILIFISAHVIDNFLYQPIVFSNTVNAHPLEIFLVILIAGSLAGITGMILAIPTYTIIRVFAKEFFNKFKLVKKLTEKIT